jgi:hypothetical protein
MDVETAGPEPPAPTPSEHIHVGPDGFTYAESAPYASAHRYLDAYLAVCIAIGPDLWRHQRLERLLSEVERARGVREMPCPEIVCATIERIGWVQANRPAVPEHPWEDMLRRLLSHLFYDRACGHVAFSPEQIDHILRLLVASYWLMGNCWYEVLPLVERAVREHPLTPERRQLVWAYVDNIVLTGLDFHIADEDAHTLARLDEMTGRIQLGLRAGDAWADAALADIDAMPEAARIAWEKLVQHALTATTSRPTKVWLRRAAERIAPIGWHEVEAHLIRWFDAATRPMHDRNATVLIGLVWCCALRDSAELAQAVGRLGEAMFKKVGLYARSLKAGNACLYTLSMMPGMESIAQLARLSLRVKGRGAQKAVGNALAVAARRAGLPRDGGGGDDGTDLRP